MLTIETVSRATTDSIMEFDALTTQYAGASGNKSLETAELASLEEAMWNLRQATESCPIITDPRIVEILGTIVVFGTSRSQINGTCRSLAPDMAAIVLGNFAKSFFAEDGSNAFGVSELSNTYRYKIVDSVVVDLLKGLVEGRDVLRGECRIAIGKIVEAASNTPLAARHAYDLHRTLKDSLLTCQNAKLTDTRKMMKPQIYMMWQELLNYTRA
jgi:hypothetical protein